MTDSPCNLIEKLNMLTLSEEMNEKDRSLKTQILFSTANDLEKMKKLKKYGLGMVVFGDEKDDFNISKNKFPENTLIYTNHATISTIKGDLAVYNQNFIIGQLIPLQNQPPNLE